MNNLKVVKKGSVKVKKIENGKCKCCGHDHIGPHSHIDRHERNRTVIKVARITIIINAVLAGIKVVSGIAGHSSAMLADAMHAFSDVLGTLAVLIGAYIADRENNREKPFLQEKIEGVISLLFGIVLLHLAFEVGYDSISVIVAGDYASIEMPTVFPLVIAVVSIIIKECLYRYSMANAQKVDSVALKAVAWHNRTDAFITLGTIIGIVGSRLGFHEADSIASVIISLLVLKVAIEILISAVRVLKRAFAAK